MTLSCMVMSAHGQGASRLTTPTGEQKKQIQDATEKLRQVQSQGDLDKAKNTARGLVDKLPGNLTDAARSALESPDIKAQATDAAKKLLPEAQKLMQSRNEDSAPAAAATPAAKTADQPPAAPEGPKALSLQPVSDSPPETADAKKAVAVVESDNSVFDPTNRILTYTGNVRARHPQFYIECEQLIVHLEEDKKDSKAAPVGKLDPIAPKGKEADKKNNPVKKAIATGPMVRIEKADPEGKVQRAFCRNAVYIGSTGVITMRDNPQVQTDNVMQIATTPDTVMTFDEKGNFNSNRRTRTVILSDDGSPATPGTNQ